jgi:3-oxoacyl-[acyl-carrier-protein] synthase II
MGALTPLGNSVSEFWNNLLAGKSGAGPITKFDASKFKSQFACEVKGFRAEDHIEKKEIKKYDLFAQYAIAASDAAIRDSGLDFTQMDMEQRAGVGVIWASGNGGISTFEEQLKEFYGGDGTPRFSPYFIPKMIVDIAAGVISIRHKLHGPNYCTVSACASSNTAIINAFDTIRLGRATIMVAGGSEAAVTPSAVGGFISAQALSAALGMQQALNDAGIKPEAIDYINAHATSTPLGDTGEMQGVKKVFGDLRPVIGGTKSMTGHLLGAAGAIESIACVLAVQNDAIPPTINTEVLDADLPPGLNIVLGKALHQKVDYALNNTFGFGGHTASSVFKKYKG